MQRGTVLGLGLIMLSLVVIGAAAVQAGWIAGGDTEQRRTVASSADGHNIIVSIRVPDPDLTRKKDGDQCTSGFPRIVEGYPLIVRDEAGTIIHTGSLLAGTVNFMPRYLDGVEWACDYGYVGTLPIREFYTFTVGESHPLTEQTYSRSELEIEAAGGPFWFAYLTFWDI